MEMYRRTFAEIDLDALENNFEAIRSRFPAETFLCPMVKANAYGHGDVMVARALEACGARALGVCLIEEGLLLRNFGVKTEILVFRGFDRQGAKKILQYRMTPVVSSWDQIEYLEEAAQGPVALHLKFDTGMNRLGFPVKEAAKLFERFNGNAKLRVKAILTHFSQGEDANLTQGQSAAQLEKLESALKIFRPLNPEVHALNSAGIVQKLSLLQGNASSVATAFGAGGDHPTLRRNWGLRPGLMIYGYNPVPGAGGINLRPVMSLKSQAGVYRTVAPGEGVSYNSTWIAKRDSVIAVVPIGYADGYHRILSNRSHALFAGQRAPVVGNICMDYLMLDVTDIVRAQNLSPSKEQEVVFFGPSAQGTMSADELAKQAGTITWEVLTSIGERVPRVYKGHRVRVLNEGTEAGG